MKNFKQFLKENISIDNWTSSGGRLGSNPGAVHTDPSGQKHYVKFYPNPDQARSEVLTSKIHKHMGINSPELSLVNKAGKIGVASPWNDNLKTMRPKEFNSVNEKQATQIATMHHAAVLTKNWDIVGLEHENIMKDHNGDLHSVDHGGAFNFRAQGAHKDFGPDISEVKSLRNPDNASGQVFNHVFKNHPEASKKALEAVKNINPDHVKGLFKDSGLANHKELAGNFLQRRDKLISHYGENHD